MALGHITCPIYYPQQHEYNSRHVSCLYGVRVRIGVSLHPALTFDRSLTSKPVRFIIGPSKKEYFVHSKNIAAMSPALDVLVQGQMREAIDGVVECEDVDEDTFLRFAQFAYTGNYETVDPTLPEAADNEHESDPVTVEQENDGFSSIFAPDRKKKKKKATFTWDEEVRPSTKHDKLWNGFLTRNYDPGPTGSHTADKNNSSGQYFAGVFLAHARVFIFADCYGVMQLEQLSLHKLHQTLSLFNMYEDIIGDIIELVCFAYEQDTPESLRELVAHFAACHMEKLWMHPDFQDLYAGELAKDMVPHLLQRLD